MTDVGVRVVEFRQRRRRSRRLPSVLGRHVREQAWPLRHIDVTVAPGETVYVLDRATRRPELFLRLATGLLRPDEGVVAGPRRSLLARPASGKATRALSVGQAIRMAAGMYGLTDRTIDRHFDDMVEFAEVRRVVNRPIDGQPRFVAAHIGFAAAVCAPVDLLGFDRNALVGDNEFRAKCAARLAELKAGGTVVVAYSPDPRQIRELADRGIVLDGETVTSMPADEFADLVVADKREQAARARRRRRRARRSDRGDSAGEPSASS